MSYTEIAQRIGEVRRANMIAAKKHDALVSPYSMHDPDKSAVARLLNCETHNPAKLREKSTGRPPLTTKAQDKRLPAAVDRVEDKNPDTNVVAVMIGAEWNPGGKQVPANLVSRRLRAMGMPFLRCRKKHQLTPEMKEAAQRWGAKYSKKPKRFWTHETLAMDCKKFAWQTSRKGRKIAKAMCKWGSYRPLTAAAGIKRSTPSRLKHRQA